MTTAPTRPLVELDPSWITRDGRVIGVMFACPLGPDGPCGGYHGVPFANPPDGGPADEWARGRGWTRTGETFETLTLSPSIGRDLRADLDDRIRQARTPTADDLLARAR